MRYLLFLVFVCTNQIVLLAQGRNVQWFPPQGMPNIPVYPLGVHNESIFHLWSVEEELRIMKSDYTFQNPEYFKISLPALSEETEMQLRVIFPLQKNLMIVGSKGKMIDYGYIMPLFNSELREFKLSSWIMGFDGKINDRPVDVMKLDQKNIDSSDESMVLMNSDSSMVAYIYEDKRDGAPSSHVDLNVINTEAYELSFNFQFDIKYDYRNPNSSHNKSSITSVEYGDQYLYMIVEHADHPGYKIKEWIEYRELWRIDPLKREIKKLKLDESGHNTGSYRLVLGENGQVGITGVFHDPKKNFGDVIGTMQIVVDGAEMKLINQSFTEFDSDWKKYFKDHAYHGSRRIFMNEHSILEIREDYEKVVGQFSVKRTYGDLYLIYHSLETGETHFSAIGKEQKVWEDSWYYGSYQVLEFPQYYSLVFNDKQINFEGLYADETKPLGILDAISSSYTVEIKVDKKTGDMSKKELLWENEGENMAVCPRQSFLGKNGEVYLLRRNHAGFQYGIIK
jgi:hypothetical protein